MNTVEPTSGGGNSPAVIVGFRLYGTTAILLPPPLGAEGKCVAVMTDNRFAALGPDNGHHIKTRVPAVKSFALHELIRRTSQKLFFLLGNGGFGRGEFLTGAGTHFHKNQIIGIQGNDIQLTTPAMHVTRQNFHIQFAPQMFCGQSFAPGTEIVRHAPSR